MGEKEYKHPLPVKIITGPWQSIIIMFHIPGFFFVSIGQNYKYLTCVPDVAEEHTLSPPPGGGVEKRRGVEAYQVTALLHKARGNECPRNS